MDMSEDAQDFNRENANLILQNQHNYMRTFGGGVDSNRQNRENQYMPATDQFNMSNKFSAPMVSSSIHKIRGYSEK